MATNARKHLIPAGSDTSVNRATIFEAFAESIRDIVPVANTTERAQLVSDLTDAGQGPSTTAPLLVFRADAPGLHRVESTTDGTVWVPASGVLQFADDTARDSWTTSYSGYLVTGDRCFSAGVEQMWDGADWVPVDSGDVEISTFGSNWIATAGYEPAVRRVGRMVVLRGAVTIQSGGSFDSILTIPEGYRPPANVFLGHFRMQTGSVQGQLHLTSAGVLQSTSPYRTGSASAGHVLPLTGTWFID